MSLTLDGGVETFEASVKPGKRVVICAVTLPVITETLVATHDVEDDFADGVLEFGGRLVGQRQKRGLVVLSFGPSVGVGKSGLRLAVPELLACWRPLRETNGTCSELNDVSRAQVAQARCGEAPVEG